MSIFADGDTEVTHLTDAWLEQKFLSAYGAWVQKTPHCAFLGKKTHPDLNSQTDKCKEIKSLSIKN